MEKIKFVAEYELRASPKMLFPYISTASGLSQWFASKVNTMPEQRFDFQWDNESHIARQVSMRQNKGVRFEFLEPSEPGADNNYIDFRRRSVRTYPIDLPAHYRLFIDHRRG